MGKMREFMFPSSDGVHDIHAVVWPADGEEKAILQIVHGISEYIERYADFAAFLNQFGYTVIGHDHLGHGKTARGSEEYGCFPERDGWHTVNRDVRSLRVWAEKEWPDLPYFMLGHSMGSFQARTYLIDYPGTVDGAIISGTGQEGKLTVEAGRFLSRLMWKLKGPRSHSKLVNTLSVEAYNKKFKPNRTSVDWISRDTAVVDAYAADSLCQFLPTVGMSYAIAEGLRYIGDPKNLARMERKTPVAFFSGAADPVGGMGEGVKKVYTLFQKAGCTKLSLKLYPGARHEILNETNRQEVYEDMLAWLEKQVKK